LGRKQTLASVTKDQRIKVRFRVPVIEDPLIAPEITGWP